VEYFKVTSLSLLGGLLENAIIVLVGKSELSRFSNRDYEYGTQPLALGAVLETEADL
jgi:hypothetical protein